MEKMNKIIKIMGLNPMYTYCDALELVEREEKILLKVE